MEFVKQKFVSIVSARVCVYDEHALREFLQYIMCIEYTINDFEFCSVVDKYYWNLRNKNVCIYIFFS